MKNRNKGFTLVELVIIIAILAILIGVLAPTYTKYIEKSRESTDLANVRTAYDKVVMETGIEGNEDVKEIVHLKQKIDKWQSSDTVTIAGISHSNDDPDTVNWKGYPVADGICEVSMNPETGILFDWKTGKGDSVENDEVKEYWFNLEENFDRVLQESNALNGVTGIFEIDSRCQKSTMVPRIEMKMASDSLLKKGTWAYYGRAKDARKRALLWTSVNTDVVGANQKIPVIVCTADNKYYVAESTTAKRTGYGPDYVAIAAQMSTDTAKKELDETAVKYDSLQAAYDAYKKLLTDGKYKQYKNSLDFNIHW